MAKKKQRPPIHYLNPDESSRRSKLDDIPRLKGDIRDKGFRIPISTVPVVDGTRASSPDTPVAEKKKSSAPKRKGSDKVKALQRRLNALGFDLDVDGIAGEKTRAAAELADRLQTLAQPAEVKPSPAPNTTAPAIKPSKPTRSPIDAIFDFQGEGADARLARLSSENEQNKEKIKLQKQKELAAIEAQIKDDPSLMDHFNQLKTRLGIELKDHGRTIKNNLGNIVEDLGTAAVYGQEIFTAPSSVVDARFQRVNDSLVNTAKDLFDDKGYERGEETRRKRAEFFGLKDPETELGAFKIDPGTPTQQKQVKVKRDNDEAMRELLNNLNKEALVQQATAGFERYNPTSAVAKIASGGIQNMDQYKQAIPENLRQDPAIQQAAGKSFEQQAMQDGRVDPLMQLVESSLTDAQQTKKPTTKAEKRTSNALKRREEIKRSTPKGFDLDKHQAKVEQDIKNFRQQDLENRDSGKYLSGGDRDLLKQVVHLSEAEKKALLPEIFRNADRAQRDMILDTLVEANERITDYIPQDELVLLLQEDEVARNQSNRPGFNTGGIVDKQQRRATRAFNTADTIDQVTGPISGIPVIGPIIGAVGGIASGVSRLIGNKSTGVDHGVAVPGHEILAADNAYSANQGRFGNFNTGGVIDPLASDMVEVDGKPGIDQNRITVKGKPINVSDKEVINPEKGTILSDSLGLDGKSFAARGKAIGKAKGKAEKIHETNPTKETENTIKFLSQMEDKVFQDQEYVANLLGERNRPQDTNSYATGGYFGDPFGDPFKNDGANPFNIQGKFMGNEPANALRSMVNNPDAQARIASYDYTHPELNFDINEGSNRSNRMASETTSGVSRLIPELGDEFTTTTDPIVPTGTPQRKAGTGVTPSLDAWRQGMTPSETAQYYGSDIVNDPDTIAKNQRLARQYQREEEARNAKAIRKKNRQQFMKDNAAGFGSALGALAIKAGQAFRPVEKATRRQDTTRRRTIGFNPDRELAEVALAQRTSANALQNSSNFSGVRAGLLQLGANTQQQRAATIERNQRLQAQENASADAFKSQQFQYNIGQGNLADQINSQNIAARDNAIDTFANSMNNIGGGVQDAVNQDKQNRMLLGILKGAYPKVYEEILGQV